MYRVPGRRDSSDEAVLEGIKTEKNVKSEPQTSAAYVPATFDLLLRRKNTTQRHRQKLLLAPLLSAFKHARKTCSGASCCPSTMNCLCVVEVLALIAPASIQASVAALVQG